MLVQIASESAKFSIMEGKWGLIPDMSLTTSLPNLVPRDVAMDLTFTSRIFTSDEALRLGLITRRVENPSDVAMKMATDIAHQSPDATAAAKKLLHATYDDARVLHLETHLQRKLLGSWNQLAKSASSLKLVPGFLLADRSSTLWSQEADDLADAKLQALLDGDGTDETVG